MYTLHFLAVSKKESGIVFIPILCFLQNGQEILELSSRWEVLVVVGMDDGVLWVLLVVTHDVFEVIMLIIGSY